MNGLIDVRQVATQILGFLVLLWIMSKFAWKPLLAQLEARRQRIADEFAEAAKRQSMADETRAQREAQLRDLHEGFAVRVETRFGNTPTGRAKTSTGNNVHEPEPTGLRAVDLIDARSR